MIGLMDCNNFFVSCERLFRPDLLGKPVAVLSSNDGCVIARSQEVKDLGISMGMPFFEIRSVCTENNVTLFSSNFKLYQDMSRRVMRVLRSEFDVCEVYSIDEAFFEIDDGSTEAEIAKVRARIIQRTGIPVSIGIATSKTLAKVANSIAKRNTVRLTKSNMYEGVCILREGEWQEVQKTLPCGSVWGIGRQTSAVLSKHKIYTVADLLEQDRAFIRGLLGVIGERLCVELSGASVYTLGESARGEQQSYTSTRSFGSSIKDKTVLMSALGHHVAQVAEKLRNDGNVASRMTVLVRGSRFGDFALRKGEASVDLMQGTSDTFTLTREASRLLDSLYDPEIPYKKAGIVMNCIAPCDAVTQQLFQGGDIHMKNQVLNRVTDVLNHRFGAGTVRNGVVFGAEKWKSSQKLISKQYTTCWDEIATVKAS